MRRLTLILVFATLILSCVQSEDAYITKLQLEFGVKYKVRVLRVIDGDTIDVLLPDGSI